MVPVVSEQKPKVFFLLPLGPSKAPQYFPTIEQCHASELQIWRSELELSEEKLKRGVLPNADRDLLYPGFPTFRHLRYRVSWYMVL